MIEKIGETKINWPLQEHITPPEFLIRALLFVSFFGFFYDDNLFYFAFAAFYLIYFFRYRSPQLIDPNNKFILHLFLLFLVLLIFANIHRVFNGTILDFNGRDWRILVHPIVCLMILDAVYSVSRSIKYRCRDVALTIITAIIVGTISYILLFSEKPLVDIMFGQGDSSSGYFDDDGTYVLRQSGLMDRNVNLVDDVYFFLSCSLAAMLIFVPVRGMPRLLVAALVMAFVIFFLNLVIESQSRSGWVGIVSGATVALFLGCLHRRVLVPILIVTTLFLVAAWKSDKIFTRVTSANAILETVWKQWNTGREAVVPDVTPKRGGAVYERILIYENAWELFKLKPWFGHGGYDPEKQKELVPNPKILVERVHTHNVLIDVTLRQGILVGLVYLIFMGLPILWLIRLGAQNRQNPELYYFCAILLVYAVYVFVQNLFNLSLIRSDPGVRIQYLYFALFGILLSELNSRQSAQ